MKPFSFDDFNNNEAWLVFRLNTQVQHQPVDIYLVMDLPNGIILCHDLLENMITQSEVNHLLKQAKTKKGNFLERIILAYGDPAEPFLLESSTKLKINF